MIKARQSAGETRPDFSLKMGAVRAASGAADGCATGLIELGRASLRV
ncbi:MAG TPA: hypothetical protein VNO52_16260 [Methylomirabilota bacterium]|nr:hypothetical protein [Methylomirabilota bacterium]